MFLIAVIIVLLIVLLINMNPPSAKKFLQSARRIPDEALQGLDSSLNCEKFQVYEPTAIYADSKYSNKYNPIRPEQELEPAPMSFADNSIVGLQFKKQKPDHLVGRETAPRTLKPGTAIARMSERDGYH